MITYFGIIITGICIAMIHTDNGFQKFLDELNDGWDAEMKYSLPGAHIPDIEQVNQVLQESFCVSLHCIPFKVGTRTMIKL